MSLVYMKVLEKKPENYEEEFQKLFPESVEIYKQILDSLLSKVKGRVLEIGCGPGVLARQLAKSGFEVVAIDFSEVMLAVAEKNAQKENLEQINFIQGDFLDFQFFMQLKDLGQFDAIVSTFVLSEFSPLRQDLFLKLTRILLKDSGKLFIAAETVPSSRLRKFFFNINRSIYTQVSVIKTGETTYPIKDFKNRLKKHFSPKLLYEKKQIMLFEAVPLPIEMNKEVPSPASVLGNFSNLKTTWCMINGIYTRKHVQPGLYRIGNPNDKSPVLVTANYYWTVKSAFNSIKTQKIDCYLLIIDSRGINVWCGAGGGHFTHSQVIDALRLFDVEKITQNRRLILPQLAATGVNHRDLQNFGWKPEFGPVYIQDLRKYLESPKKTEHQGKVRFGFLFRNIMGLQHTFFIFLSIFLPLSFLLGLISLTGNSGSIFWFKVTLQLTILGCIVSMAFAWLYPLFGFTQSFFKKGMVIGIITLLCSVGYLYWRHSSVNLITLTFWSSMVLMVSLFIVLDFSGNTSDSNHLDVESDLILFSVPALLLLLIAIISTGIDSVAYLL
ncbi:MAG: methyltransferase domain-containing protein [Promethearchaeota archaeon]